MDVVFIIKYAVYIGIKQIKYLRPKIICGTKFDACQAKNLFGGGGGAKVKASWLTMRPGILECRFRQLRSDQMHRIRFQTNN